MKLSTIFRKIPFGFKPIVVSFVILSFSVMLSLYENDWVHFERSGSLLVIVALFFFWRDDLAEKEEIIKDFMEYEDYCNENTTPIKPGDDLEGVDLHIWYPVNREKVDIDFKRDKKFYQTIEVVIASLGTFIWAYGNFFMQLFLPL